MTRKRLLTAAALSHLRPAARGAGRGYGLAGPRLSALAVTFAADSPAKPADTGDTRPKAIEYSDAYYTRLTIHRYASYAELPLFATEYALGQKILNGQRTGRLRVLGHPLGAQGRRRRARRAVRGQHGDRGVEPDRGAARSRPGAPGGTSTRYACCWPTPASSTPPRWPATREESEDGDANRHRNAAIASISVATASTLMMWLWKD